MNIFQKFKEEKRYIQLLTHHRGLKEDYRKREDESINAICEYIEDVVKTKAYQEKMLNEFRENAYNPFLRIAEMSILIQALDKESDRLAAEYFDEREQSYCYSPATFNFNNSTIDEYITGIFSDFVYDYGLDDTYYISIDLSCNNQKKIPINSHINLIRTEIEYVDDGNYEYVYYLDSRFKKGIRALYQCMLEMKNEIKDIMLEHINEEKVDYEH